MIPFIKEVYSKIEVEDHSFQTSLNLLVQYRTQREQCLLRPYLVRLGYELAGSANWVDIAPACAALEIFNISTYQSNLAFDGKNGVVSNHDKNNQFISSMISGGLVATTILALGDKVGWYNVSKLIGRFHETNNDIYIGQFYDLNELHLRKLDLRMPEENYLKLYTGRCERLGGSLTSLCLELGWLLGKGDDHMLAHIRDLGRLFGTAGQMVNDLSDLIRLVGEGPNGRSYSAPFSDLRMGKITYPLFHLLRHGSDKQRETVLRISQSKEEEPALMGYVTRLMHQCGTVKAVRAIVLAYYKMLKKRVKLFPESEARAFLSMAFSSLLTNKYFASLREYDGEKHAYKNLGLF